MKPHQAFGLSIFLLVLAANSAVAEELVIKSVAVKPMKKDNLCAVLGGSSTPPAVTIKHTKTAGAKLKVEMFDILNTGKRYRHGSKTIRASVSGTTVLKHKFFSPCNFYGDTISNYKFKVSSGKQSVIVDWASFSSKQKKIIR